MSDAKSEIGEEGIEGEIMQAVNRAMFYMEFGR